MSTTRAVLDVLVGADADLTPHLDAGTLDVEGDADVIRGWFGLLTTFPMFFPIVEP